MSQTITPLGLPTILSPYPHEAGAALDTGESAGSSFRYPSRDSETGFSFLEAPSLWQSFSQPSDSRWHRCKGQSAAKLKGTQDESQLTDTGSKANNRLIVLHRWMAPYKKTEGGIDLITK